MHSHPELAIAPETHFIPTLAKICQRSSDPRQAFLKRLAANQHWQQMQIKEELLRERVEKIHPFDFTAALRESYMLYAEKFGKPRWGEKTPPYVLYMSLIQKVLPEAYFVHIIRDGRDVALSVKDVWFGPDTFEKAGGWWSTRITSAREQAASLPHYLEIRYENLVLNPQTELKRVCEFIDLPYDPAMLEFTETAADLRQIEPVKGDNIHPLITQKLQTTRIGRWKTDMTKSDRRQFEKVAGKMLLELGYEV